MSLMAMETPTSNTPLRMKASIGWTRVCGQFTRSSSSSFQPPAVAVALSQASLRCGSSPSDLTVRMPRTLSTSTVDLSISASA